MGIKDVIDGKKKWRAQWRAHMARIKVLPPDYQVVYKEIQKYLFKIGGGTLLFEIVDFFEEGAAAGKGVLELIGTDVAAFCDGLVNSSRTNADIYQEQERKAHSEAPRTPGELPDDPTTQR